MRTLGLNVFILSENALVAAGLKNNLESRFNNAITLQNFYDVKSMLKHINPHTDVLIVDYVVDGQKGSDIMKAAKDISPELACVYHTTQDEVVHCLETLLAEEPVHTPHQLTYTLNPRIQQTYARR